VNEKTCPQCGHSLSTLWCKDRKLKKRCGDYPDCEWEGKPYTPPKKPIRTVKTISTDQGGWEYEGFDQYGHTFVCSQGFGSKEACVRAAKEELRKMNSSSLNSSYGKCVAVIWPPTTQIRGIKVT